MEFLIPTSLTAITIISLLLVFAAVQIIIDTRDIRRSGRLHKTLIAIAKKQSEQSFTVVVELTRQAETILPLLGHLYAHQYSKLEVIVVIKHTAGKNARTVLERYRRTNRLKGLRIVKHVRGLATRTVLQRYGSGSLAMVLRNDERLSPNFFVAASIEALQKKDDVITLPERHIQISNTVTSALQTHADILKQTMMRVFGVKSTVKPLSSGVVYRRRPLLTGNASKEVVQLVANHQLYITRSTEVQKFSSYFTQSINNTSLPWAIGIGVGSIITATVLTLLPAREEQLLLIASLVLLYVLTNVTIQLRTKGYSLVDRINLALVSPIALVYSLVVHICALILILLRAITPAHNNRSKLSHRLKPLKQ